MTVDFSMVNLEFWQGGLSLEQYVDSMAHKQEPMRRRLKSVTLSHVEQAAFSGLPDPIYVLVMTEDWCLDSLMNLPILAAIANAAPVMQIRIFPRSLNPDLQSEFAARGIQNIPLFVFYDADFREIGLWVERSQAAHGWNAAWNAANPQLDAILHDASLTKDERRSMLAPLTARKQLEVEQAYAQKLQSATVAEIQAILVGQVVP